MKWVGATIAGVFLGFVFLIVFILFKSGMFKPVIVEQGSRGPFIAVYQNRLGPYHLGSSTLFDVEQTLKKQDFICRHTFGIYIDDPNDTEAERLRSELGCLFDEKYKDQLAQITSDPSLKLNLKYIDMKNYVIGSFEGSPALVSFKVYPKMKEWAEQNRYTLKPQVLEIYEVKSSNKVKTSVLFEVL